MLTNIKKNRSSSLIKDYKLYMDYTEKMLYMLIEGKLNKVKLQFCNKKLADRCIECFPNINKNSHRPLFFSKMKYKYNL